MSAESAVRAAVLLAREPGVLSGVLWLTYRAIEGHLLAQAGLTRPCAQSGAVTLIQRFGSALNLNVHLHMLFLDGVYEYAADGRVVFHCVDAPTVGQLQALAFTLQSVPAITGSDSAELAQGNGFSLHAGVWAGANDRAKLERLCRYTARPAVSNERLELTDCGHVRYELKTSYRDGTTHVYFNPLDFIVRLAALVPKPRVNLTRFHGVFARNSHLRSQVTASGRGKRRAAREDATPAERHRALGWTQRLKRVFNLDVERCEHCGVAMKILAAIEDTVVIEKLLRHLETHPPCGPPTALPLQAGSFLRAQ